MHQSIATGLEPTSIPATAAGSTTLDYNITSLEGMRELVAQIFFGATMTVADANPFIQVFQASLSDYSDAVEITAAKTALVAGMASLGVHITIARPTKKYLRVRINRGGGSNSIQVAGGVINAVAFRHLVDPLPATLYSRSIYLAS